MLTHPLQTACVSLASLASPERLKSKDDAEAGTALVPLGLPPAPVNNLTLAPLGQTPGGQAGGRLCRRAKSKTPGVPAAAARAWCHWGEPIVRA
jgi:hypothetical protein